MSGAWVTTVAPEIELTGTCTCSSPQRMTSPRATPPCSWDWKGGVSTSKLTWGAWRLCRTMSVTNSKLLKKQSFPRHTGTLVTAVSSGVARPGCRTWSCSDVWVACRGADPRALSPRSAAVAKKPRKVVWGPEWVWGSLLPGTCAVGFAWPCLLPCAVGRPWVAPPLCNVMNIKALLVPKHQYLSH